METSIISLVAASISISENGSIAIIPVERTGNLSTSVSFDYSVTSSIALAGEDFTASTGTLTFAPQQDRIEIQVPIVEDENPEIDESFNIQIGEPSLGGELGLIRSAVITIEDNDPPGNNTINFSEAQYSVNEDGGVATITVTRSGSLDQVATVEYSTSDNYARNGKDFIATSGILTFASGEGSQTFDVPIINDTLPEFDETLTLSLQNAAGAALGAQNVAKLTISETQPFPYQFEENVVITGLAEGASANFSSSGPTAFDWAPDGAMFIAKFNGIVRVFDNGQLLDEPFIDIRDQVNIAGQRGLLGLAVHPEFPTSPYIYLAFSYDPPDVQPDQFDASRTTRLIRLEADPATGYRTALPNSEEVLLETDLIGNFHAAGTIKFGTDGALYFTHGDGQAVGTTTNLEKAELLSSLDNYLGKMFRIDPLTGEGFTDNPFYDGDVNSIRSKVYNYGLRNPFRWTFKPGTSEPFIGDVGQATWEEINHGAGEFFGWNLYEGGNGVSQRFSNVANNSNFQDLYNTFDNIVAAPIYAENHADGAVAIVLGDFYSGTELPEIYQGALFFSDFGSNTVKALTFDEEGNPDSTIPVDDALGRGITYMAMGPDNKLYFADLLSGEISTFTATLIDVDEVEPPLPPPPSSSTPIQIEAEAADSLSGYFILDNPLVSGGQALRTGSQGTATYTFNGPAGDYILSIGTIDENDGAASLAVAQNDNLLNTIVLDQPTDSGFISVNNQIERAVATVIIAPGDIFTVTGTREQQEYARFDFLRFLPVEEETALAPTITTPNTATVAENATTVLDVEATDADGDTEGNGLTYSLTGGSDQTVFSIDPATGVLSFAVAPDFENPGDSDGDNVYNLEVSVTDLTNLSDVQSIAVTVTDVDETEPLLPPPPSSSTPIQIEAEAADSLSGYFVLDNPLVSGGQALRVGSQGTATYTFNGSAGDYTLSIGTIDENDGAASLAVAQNGNLLNTIVLDQSTDSGFISVNNQIERTVATVTIAPGDTFTVTGTRDNGEFARFDFLRFLPFEVETPVASTITLPNTIGNSEPILLEAEAATFDNYRIESIEVASGGQALSFRGGSTNEVGSATFDFNGVPGDYDIILGVFDEDDGEASLSIELNDSETGETTEIGSLLLDESLLPTGITSYVVNADNFISPTVVLGVTLTPGDTITVNGFEDASEHARLDYLQFNPVGLL